MPLECPTGPERATQHNRSSVTTAADEAGSAHTLPASTLIVWRNIAGRFFISDHKKRTPPQPQLWWGSSVSAQLVLELSEGTARSGRPSVHGRYLREVPV